MFKVPPPPDAKLRNPITRARTARETLWQIWAPLALAGIAAITVWALIILPAGAPARSHYANLAIIWLILPIIVAGVVVFVICGALIYATGRLMGKIPYYARYGQDWMKLTANYTRHGAARLTELFVAGQALTAGLRQIPHSLNAVFTRRRPR